MSISEAFNRVKNAFLYKVMLRFPYLKVRIWALKKLGHVCGQRVYFSSDVTITQVFVRNRGKLTLGDRAAIGPGVIFILNSGPSASQIRSKMPEKDVFIVVGQDAWIGAGAIVLPGVTIGEGAVIGAGAVVTKDVDPFTVVAGNPAHVIRKI